MSERQLALTAATDAYLEVANAELVASPAGVASQSALSPPPAACLLCARGAQPHPGLLATKVWIGFQAKTLPGVFMTGASVGQDLICRARGRTRAGDPIDLEFGARTDLDGIAGTSYFTYLRYNADLSTRALVQAGITDPRDQQQLRKLDAVGSIPQLQALGQRVGATVQLDPQLAGFL